MDPPLMSQTASDKLLFPTHFSFKSLLLKGLKAFERKMVAALQRKNHWLSGSLNRWWVGSLNAGGSNDGEVGDGIQYLRRHRGMSFPEAVATLSGAIYQKSTPQHLGQQYFHRLDSENKTDPWKTERWQSAAKKLILAAQSYLLGPNGKERFSYLIHERGLHRNTICSISWDGCRQQHTCLRNSLFHAMIVGAVSSESDFVLTTPISDNNDTESARAATLTPLFH